MFIEGVIRGWGRLGVEDRGKRVDGWGEMAQQEEQNGGSVIRSAGVVGASGLVGRAVSCELAERGIGVSGFSRRPAGRSQPGVAEWRSSEDLDVAGLDAVVNLAGESVARRWTAANRRAFHASRVGLTGRLVDSIGRLGQADRPRLLVNASAVGIYGDGVDEVLDESAAPGKGYLAELCVEWEQAAVRAEQLGVRVVCLRIGVVLGRGGPAFEKLRRLFALGVGGRLGSGRQWMPWVHIADLAGAVGFMLCDGRLDGPVNGTAPGPERNAEFTRKLAAELHRPALLPVPGFALKLVLGGFGGALLEGQRAVPGALLESGFEFRFPDLESALSDLLGG